MKNFVFLNREEDFEYAERERAKRVIIRDPLNKEIVKRAKESGFSVWVMESCTEDIPVCTIEGFAGRPDREDGIISAVTCSSFEKMLLGMGKSLEFIDGFVLPVPEFSGLLWNDDFEEMLNDAGEVFDIFDEYVIESSVRSLYYEAAEEYLITKYIEPVYAMAKKIEKSISFNVGGGEIHYDFMPVINPIRLISEGFSLAFEKRTPEIEAFCSLREDECFIPGEGDAKALDSEKVLLIKPVRGCRERYVYLPGKGRVRPENPALCASYEGTYYCERLAGRMDFAAVDEYTLENSAYAKDGKLNLLSQSFESVIVCDSCRFTEKGMDILRSAKNSGVSINSAELIQKLSAENLEEI